MTYRIKDLERGKERQRLNRTRRITEKETRT